jgi:alpha-L-rhamnosidase
MDLSAEEKEDKMILKVEAGKLQVTYMPTCSYFPTLSLKSSLKDVLANETGTAILCKYLGSNLERINIFPGLIEGLMNKPLTADPIFGVTSSLNAEKVRDIEAELVKCCR